MILETVLVLVGLFAADDGTPEWLDLFGERKLWDVGTIHHLLLLHPLGHLALVAVGKLVVLEGSLQLLLT